MKWSLVRLICDIVPPRQSASISHSRESLSAGKRAKRSSKLFDSIRNQNHHYHSVIPPKNLDATVTGCPNCLFL
jgi:hypothetical protein